MPPRGLRQLRDQRLRILPGRRIVLQPQDRASPKLITNLDQGRVVELTAHELVEVGNGLFDLPGADQVVDRAPELHRRPGLLDERLGPGHLGFGRGRQAGNGQRQARDRDPPPKPAATSSLQLASIRDCFIPPTEQRHGISEHGISPIRLKPGGFAWFREPHRLV